MGDVFLDGVFDLFGDPVPRSRGKRGKPPHVPTSENRRFVELSLACGYDEDAIAAALKITTKTLGRHYFHELDGKRSTRMRLEMKLLAGLVAKAESGEVSAMALLDRKIERMKLKDLSARYVDEPRRTKPQGKKEEAKTKAAAIGGKFAPPPAPSLIN